MYNVVKKSAYMVDAVLLNDLRAPDVVPRHAKPPVGESERVPE